MSWVLIKEARHATNALIDTATLRLNVAMAEAVTSGVDGHDEEIINTLRADGEMTPLAGASPRGVPPLIRAPTTTFTSANALPTPSASASHIESPTEELKSSAISAEQEAVFRRRRLTREYMDGEIESPPVQRRDAAAGRSWAAQTQADEALKPGRARRSRRMSREPSEKETVVWEVNCGHHTGTHGSTGSARAPHRTTRHRTTPHSTACAQ